MFPELTARTADILGGEAVLGRLVTTQLDAHSLIVEGLPTTVVPPLLAGFVRVGPPELAELFGSSTRTLQRRKKDTNARLPPNESGKVWQFAELLALSVEVFGTRKAAVEWLESPAWALDGAVPLDLARSPAGMSIVEAYLQRVLHGVYT
jgi:putative toxin-antitoxin system antitoxin component (TIGR02293 family)